MGHTDELERQAEEKRLIARTEELQWRIVAMSLEHAEYDEYAHEALLRDLATHRQELENHRARFPDSDLPDADAPRESDRKSVS